jgi:hypothetical protein
MMTVRVLMTMMTMTRTMMMMKSGGAHLELRDAWTHGRPSLRSLAVLARPAGRAVCCGGSPAAGGFLCGRGLYAQAALSLPTAPPQGVVQEDALEDPQQDRRPVAVRRHPLDLQGPTHMFVCALGRG